MNYRTTNGKYLELGAPHSILFRFFLFQRAGGGGGKCFEEISWREIIENKRVKQPIDGQMKTNIVMSPFSNNNPEIENSARSTY